MQKIVSFIEAWELVNNKGGWRLVPGTFVRWERDTYVAVEEQCIAMQDFSKVIGMLKKGDIISVLLKIGGRIMGEFLEGDSIVKIRQVRYIGEGKWVLIGDFSYFHCDDIRQVDTMTKDVIQGM